MTDVKKLNELIAKANSNVETDFEGDSTYRIHITTAKELIRRAARINDDRVKELEAQLAEIQDAPCSVVYADKDLHEFITKNGFGSLLVRAKPAQSDDVALYTTGRVHNNPPPVPAQPSHRVLILASYCGNDNSLCSDEFPCNDCLMMCNVANVTGEFKIFGGFDYMSAARGITTLNYKSKFECLVEHCKRQDKRISNLVYDENIRRYYDSGAVWFWAGDDSENLETLACPVVIGAGDLRALLAKKDE